MRTSSSLFAAIAALCIGSCAASSTTVTVAHTVTHSAITTKTKTITSISTTTAAQPECTTLMTEGIAIGFGADPLSVTGTGDYLGFDTPANASKAANSGNGYLVGHFGKNPSNTNDIFQIASSTIPVLPNTAYQISVASRQTAPNAVFCKLNMLVNYNYPPNQNSEAFNLGGDWETNAVPFQTGNQTMVDFQIYAQCDNGLNGPVVAYGVLFDDVIISPQDDYIYG